jgi:hypothetical protein
MNCSSTYLINKFLNIFVAYAFISQIGTQTMHIKPIYTTALLFFP